MVSVGKVQHLFETCRLKEFNKKDIGQRVWNCDETGFCTAVASKLVLAKRGAKTVHEVGGGSGREYITVLGKHCISLLTLLWIMYYYSLWISKWHTIATVCCIQGSWFKKMFLKQVEHLLKDGPVVLFVDGHHSHITSELINLARDHGVHLMCLPPNLTHILQPFDVSVFHPLKQAYFKILKG